MPLKRYKRGAVWWVSGSCDGLDEPVRRSLGTRDENVAKARVKEIEAAAWKRAVLGSDAPKAEDELTFGMAFMLYNPPPADAGYLVKLLPRLKDMRVRDITGNYVKELARKVYPTASTDTWHRQVIVPVRAVINNAHQHGKCAPIQIKTFTKMERMAQDRARGKQSRQKKKAGSWEWVEAFRAQAMVDRLPYMAALCLFMFTRGARVTQSIQITPNMLDLQNARVKIPAAKGHPEQWIWIDTDMVVELANLPPRKGRVFGYRSRHSVTDTWKRICERAGIEHIPPHCAGRHGYGTEMVVRQGVDPASVALDGRWSSPRIVLEHYSHAEDSENKVREALKKGRNRTIGVQRVRGKRSK